MNKESNRNEGREDAEGQDQAPAFPMRINKYLAMAKGGSRREMDKAIAEGKVILNGRLAVLGDKVNEGDVVEVRFKAPKGPAKR